MNAAKRGTADLCISNASEASLKLLDAFRLEAQGCYEQAVHAYRSLSHEECCDHDTQVSDLMTLTKSMALHRLGSCYARLSNWDAYATWSSENTSSVSRTSSMRADAVYTNSSVLQMCRGLIRRLWIFLSVKKD